MQRSFLKSPLTLTDKTTLLILYALFFLSGVAALIYQIMWQRLLFTVFGVDLLSITLIVSVFMFGLGVGGLCGGIIANNYFKHLLQFYLALEIAIAAFGFSSPFLIESLGNKLFSVNPYLTGFSAYLLLAVPTLLMGATFPILVAYVNQFYRNVGKSVGTLYFANTLGGAAGAYFSGFLLLYSMDIPGAINQAAILNLIVAFSVYIFFRKTP